MATAVELDEVEALCAEAPLLDYMNQSSTESETRLDYCPTPQTRPGWVLVDPSTGETFPGFRCRRNGCPYCVHVNARRRALAIAWAEPERAITLTAVASPDAPEAWSQARRVVNRTREYLRREGFEPGEWLYHVEPNPRGTGHHVHAWQHGPRLDIEGLRVAAVRAGAGSWLHLSRVRSSTGASAYGLKGLGYGLKGTETAPSGYLGLNGGRLTHHSRGYFRGESVRDAERASLRALVADRGEWLPWIWTTA